MVTKHRLLYRCLEYSISDYYSQDDYANPEVRASTLRVPWVMKVIAVGYFIVLSSPISTADISARSIHCEVDPCTLLLIQP